MKAAVFYGKEDLRIQDIPKPEVGDHDVLIRVRACGVCGTDMHIFDGDEGAAPTPSGTVLGHEFAGQVEQVGKFVTDVAVGDAVCVDPNQLCNVCDFCRDGIGHFCESMIGIGTTVHGGFAEYCCVPRSQVYKCRTDRYTQAAMTEPVACCLHGIEMCDIIPGTAVAVIGGGMIGLLMLQLAKIKGASTLVMIEPIAAKRELAQKLGTDLTIDPIQENVTAVLNKNGIDRLTTVIECVGKPATMEQAISLAGKKSTVMLFGLTKPDAESRSSPLNCLKKRSCSRPPSSILTPRSEPFPSLKRARSTSPRWSIRPSPLSNCPRSWPIKRRAVPANTS